MNLSVLANTAVSSVDGGDAALCQTTLTALFSLLQAEGRNLMPSQLMDMLCDVASGMQHIISKGFVHTVRGGRTLVLGSLDNDVISFLIYASWFSPPCCG